jgi:hypothetical protein
VAVLANWLLSPKLTAALLAAPLPSPTIRLPVRAELAPWLRISEPRWTVMSPLKVLVWSSVADPATRVKPIDPENTPDCRKLEAELTFNSASVPSIFVASIVTSPEPLAIDR